MKRTRATIGCRRAFLRRPDRGVGRRPRRSPLRHGGRGNAGEGERGSRVQPRAAARQRRDEDHLPRQHHHDGDRTEDRPRRRLRLRLHEGGGRHEIPGDGSRRGDPQDGRHRREGPVPDARGQGGVLPPDRRGGTGRAACDRHRRMDVRAAQRSSPTWAPTSGRAWRGMPKKPPRSGQVLPPATRSGRNGTSSPSCSGRNRPPLPPRPPSRDLSERRRRSPKR